jgi:hypothetical protein
MKTLFRLLLGIIPVITLIFLNSCKQDSVTNPNADSTAVWAKTYGGPNSDVINTVIPLSDGSCIAAGITTSYGAGDNDALLMKLNNKGEVQWTKVFGGSGSDVINSAVKTSDGGIIMVGTTTSFGASQIDVMIIKTDETGDLEWSKFYRMPGDDYGMSIRQTDDGGYAIAGYSNSFGAGNNDILFMKIDASGEVIWDKFFGGPFNDVVLSMKYFNGGGFILAGNTFSNNASGDILLLSLYGDGVFNWCKTYGGEDYDQANDVQITSDAGYIVAGYTKSYGLISGDAFFIKTTGNGTLEWSKTIGGGTGLDQNLAVIQTADGGYLAAGETYSFGGGLKDMMTIRLFGNGVFSWMRVTGGINNESGTGVIENGDNSLIFSGIGETTANVYDIQMFGLKKDGSGCTGNISVSPLGGDPVTPVVNYNDISVMDALTVETIDAPVMVNPIVIGVTTQCGK